MIEELKELKIKIREGNPQAYFFTNLEDVLWRVFKKQPSDREIQQFLLIEGACVKDLLFYIVSNWKFGKTLNEQDDDFIKGLNDVIK